MSENTSPAPPTDLVTATPKPPKLAPRDKVAIVNALMTQDRLEIRNQIDMVFRVSYVAIPGLFAIASVGSTHAQWQRQLLIASCLVTAVFLLTFIKIREWLKHTRACLMIREEFYKDEQMFFADKFEPIRHLVSTDYEHQFKDNAIWVPFIVTLVAAAATMLYLCELTVK